MQHYMGSVIVILEGTLITERAHDWSTLLPETSMQKVVALSNCDFLRTSTLLLLPLLAKECG